MQVFITLKKVTAIEVRNTGTYSHPSNETVKPPFNLQFLQIEQNKNLTIFC